MSILVSGKNGQLGRELQDIVALNKNHEFIFFDKLELNITDDSALEHVFKKYAPSFFINSAAYTAVDKAETDQENAYAINAAAVGNIARQCYRFNTRLIHVSTDYVFNGKGTNPYKEDDKTDPVNYYGYTKWLGEQLAFNNNPATVVIRTSWVYSRYGNNFVKTMLRLMKERREINVVNDQFGSPTYAADLAGAIMQIVNGENVNREFMQKRNRSSNVNEEGRNKGKSESQEEITQNSKLKTQNSKLKTQNSYGIYHFSNEGIVSWYDFAVAIKEIKQLDCIVHPIPTSVYPTPAKRPAYSGLDKNKIAGIFHIDIKNWKESLGDCLRLL